jgi:hypothetical protein
MFAQSRFEQALTQSEVCFACALKCEAEGKALAAQRWLAKALEWEARAFA